MKKRCDVECIKFTVSPSQQSLEDVEVAYKYYIIVISDRDYVVWSIWGTLRTSPSAKLYLVPETPVTEVSGGSKESRNLP